MGGRGVRPHPKRFQTTSKSAQVTSKSDDLGSNFHPSRARGETWKLKVTFLKPQVIDCFGHFQALEVWKWFWKLGTTFTSNFQTPRAWNHFWNQPDERKLTMSPFDKINCRTCHGTGRACDKPNCGACVTCHGTGHEFAAIAHEIDIPCGLPADRDCPKCRTRKPVRLKWTNGPAIARCCPADHYVCAMPKQAIAAAIAALEASNEKKAG